MTSKIASSGSEESVEKNSRIETTSFPLSTGKANEDLNPACRATAWRAKCGSLATSLTQVGRALMRALMGRSATIENSLASEAARKASKRRSRVELQMWVEARWGWPTANTQACPNDQEVN